MTADRDFWDGLLQGLDLEELDLLEEQIRQRKAKLQNRTVARKSIIRK